MFLKASSGPNGGMSVDLRRPIEEAGLDALSFTSIPPPASVGSVLFQVRVFRDNQFQVGYDPIENDPVKDNPYHGLVWGNFKRSAQRAILQEGRWLNAIGDVDLE
jgi:hypothetical protein